MSYKRVHTYQTERKVEELQMEEQIIIAFISFVIQLWNTKKKVLTVKL